MRLIRGIRWALPIRGEDDPGLAFGGVHFGPENSIIDDDSVALQRLDLPNGMTRLRVVKNPGAIIYYQHLVPTIHINPNTLSLVTDEVAPPEGM